MASNTADHPYHILQESLSEQVYHYIKHMILSGQISGGEKIPENRISEQLGVSRTPIREALRRLEQLGLIQIKPRSYAVVKSLEETEATDIALVRLSLEQLTVRLLIKNDRLYDLSPLRELQSQCIYFTEQGNFAGSYEIDSKLHVDLAKLTGNAHLFDLMERLDTRIQLLRLKQKVPKEGLLKYVKQHDQLFQSIEEKNMGMGMKLIEAHIMHDV